MSQLRILAILATLALSVSAWAGPIGFNSAMPVYEGGWLIREQAMLTRMAGDTTPMGREIRAFAVPSVLVWGANRKLTLMTVFPYVNKKLTINALGLERQSKGLGDIKTMARFEVFRKSRGIQSLRGSLLVGVKWPTGRNDIRDAVGPLPPMLQPGSGSYDFVLGSVWSKAWSRSGLDIDLAYRKNIEADGYQFGDLLEQNLSYQLRLFPWVLPSAGVPSFLNAVFETKQVFQDRDSAQGIEAANTGGYRLLGAVGIQWIGRRIVLESEIQLPIYENLNGTALGFDYKAVFSVRWWI